MPYSTKQKRAMHRKKNRDEFNAKKRIYMVKFREEHPDYEKNYAKQHYIDHKDEYLKRALNQKQDARKNEIKFLSQMLSRVRYRAKKRGIPFNISLDDLKIPKVCPVLGVSLKFGALKGTQPAPNSPSIDKFFPHLGYIPTNIRIISYRANVLKRDGTLKEFENLVRWMKKNNN